MVAEIKAGALSLPGLIGLGRSHARAGPRHGGRQAATRRFHALSTLVSERRSGRGPPAGAAPAGVVAGRRTGGLGGARAAVGNDGRPGPAGFPQRGWPGGRRRRVADGPGGDPARPRHGFGRRRTQFFRARLPERGWGGPGQPTDCGAGRRSGGWISPPCPTHHGPISIPGCRGRSVNRQWSCGAGRGPCRSCARRWAGSMHREPRPRVDATRHHSSIRP